MDHGKVRVDTSALMSPMAETPLLSHVLTCDTFSGPALSPSPNVVQIVHVPLTCPCPCNQNVPHPLCTCFPIPTLSQRSPPSLSVLIRQPNLQPLSPSSGFPSNAPNHNSIQVGLCPILQCSDPTPHSPSSSLL